MGKKKQKKMHNQLLTQVTRAIDKGNREYIETLSSQKLTSLATNGQTVFEYALKHDKCDMVMLLLEKIVSLQGFVPGLKQSLKQSIVPALEKYCPSGSIVPQWLMDQGISTELFQTLLPYLPYKRNNSPFDAAHLLVNAAKKEESPDYLPVLANNLIGLNSWDGTVNLGVLFGVDDETFRKIFLAFSSATKSKQLIGKINSVQDDNTEKLFARMVQLVPNIFQENLFPGIIEELPDDVGIFITILEGTKKEYTTEDYEKMLQAAVQWRRLQIAQYLIVEKNAPLVQWSGSSLFFTSPQEIDFVRTPPVLRKTFEQQSGELSDQQILVPSFFQESYYNGRNIAKHLLKAGINDVELRKTTLEQTAWVLLYRAIESMPLSINTEYYRLSGWGINGFINHLCNPTRGDTRTAAYLDQIVEQLTGAEEISGSKLKVFEDDGRHFDREAVKKRFEYVHRWITDKLDEITKSDTCLLDEIEKKISQKSIRDCIREGVPEDNYLTLPYYLQQRELR
ncbi:MAG: hypothetical protein ACK5O9_07255 [Holosporales bacterium]|jgi:hypothetical protein